MNLFLRFIFVLLKYRKQRGFRPLQELRLNMRVLPNDLDFNLHMNNGRYLTIMDLGRVALMKRAGLFEQITKHKWMPVVGIAAITFIKSLQPFEKYQLSTQIIYFDERWFYIRQEFWRGDTKVASAIVKGLFVGKDGSIPSSEVMAAVGHKGLQSPKKPQYLDDLDDFRKDYI